MRCFFFLFFFLYSSFSDEIRVPLSIKNKLSYEAVLENYSLNESSLQNLHYKSVLNLKCLNVYDSAQFLDSVQQNVSLLDAFLKEIRSSG